MRRLHLPPFVLSLSKPAHAAPRAVPLPRFTFISAKNSYSCCAAGDNDRPLRRISPTLRVITGSTSGTLTSNGWSGPGMAIGSALALKGSDRLPVAILGDGDYMMGVNALWTAANARIPMLVVVCNNRSFFNDELHQERVARQRSRPVENRWIGQRISDPPPDLAMMARGQGLTGFGPIEDAGELAEVLQGAIAAVQQGETVVIDVVVATGYSPAMAAGMTRSKD